MLPILTTGSILVQRFTATIHFLNVLKLSVDARLKLSQPHNTMPFTVTQGAQS